MEKTVDSSGGDTDQRLEEGVDTVTSLTSVFRRVPAGPGPLRGEVVTLPFFSLRYLK